MLLTTAPDLMSRGNMWTCEIFVLWNSCEPAAMPKSISTLLLLVFFQWNLFSNTNTRPSDNAEHVLPHKIIQSDKQHRRMCHSERFTERFFLHGLQDLNTSGGDLLPFKTATFLGANYINCWFPTRLSLFIVGFWLVLNFDPLTSPSPWTSLW